MKKFNIKRFILFLFCLFIIGIICLIGAYYYLISPVDNNNDRKVIYVEEGNTYSGLGEVLKENNLIKSSLVYKIYIKINPPKEELEAGNYVLKSNYSLKEILSTIEKGSVNLNTVKTVTFVEGKNIRYYISKITSSFNIGEEEILNKLSDHNYLDRLINDYWFLTDEIKNKDIYYSLEGYLYPDTYEFYDNADIDDIIRKMLDNTGKKLEEYKSDIENSDKTLHEMLTLASIVELEAGASDDRKGVAGVFYNRLKDNWTLGSDVTTYYAEKIDNWSRDLKNSELNRCNAYNTRSTCMPGKLPVGPICNPGIDSISSAITPKEHKYYYFVADKYGKTYFNKSYSAHSSEVARLKREGLWIEYEN